MLTVSSSVTCSAGSSDVTDKPFTACGGMGSGSHGPAYDSQKDTRQLVPAAQRSEVVGVDLLEVSRPADHACLLRTPA